MNNNKIDILDTFSKLMFFSKHIDRERSPEIEEQDKVNYEQWKQTISDYLEDSVKKLKALEIIKENIGLKMSVDDNVVCLYVPIVKTFEPLEKNIVVVGFVQGQDKIDVLKEVL